MSVISLCPALPCPLMSYHNVTHPFALFPLSLCIFLVGYIHRKNLWLNDPVLYWHPRPPCNIVIVMAEARHCLRSSFTCDMQTWSVLSLLLTWPYGMCPNLYEPSTGGVFLGTWPQNWWLFPFRYMDNYILSWIVLTLKGTDWQSQGADMIHWVWFSTHVLLRAELGLVNGFVSCSSFCSFFSNYKALCLDQREYFSVFWTLSFLPLGRF